MKHYYFIVFLFCFLLYFSLCFFFKHKHISFSRISFILYTNTFDLLAGRRAILLFHLCRVKSVS